MPIYEYHSFEDEGHPMYGKDCGCLFDGRWIVKQMHDVYPSRQPDGSYGYYYLEWTDLFRQQDQKRIILSSDRGRIVLLSEHLALLKNDACSSHPQLFWALQLDWKNMTIKKGESVLQRSQDWSETVIVDRAGPLPNGDICFLLLNTGERRYNDDGERVRKAFDCAHHCRLDSRDLKIVRDSQPIPLDSDDFNCIDLNGDIISGLSTSLLEIKRYNFRTRRLVDTILVHGLPPTISCLWHKHLNQVFRTPRGAWTDSHLLVWSNEGWEFNGTEDEYYDLVDKPDEPEATKITSVYDVDFKTGFVSATALNFKGWIKEFVVGPDGNHLYLRVDEFLRRSSKGDRHFDYHPPIYKFRYFRVPFNRPESLFFLASVALPRPLSPLALEIIKQNSKTAPIPLNVIK